MVEGMIQNPLRESIHHNPTTKGSSIQPKKAARGFQRARMSMSVAPSKKSSPYKPYPPGAFQSSLEHDIGDTVTVVTPECLQQQVFAQQQLQQQQLQQSTTTAATTKKRKPTTTTTTDTNNKKGGGSLELAWERKYAQLLQFYEKHGHANVPVTYPEDQKLSHWCRRHRDANNYPHLYPGGIRDDRRAKLNALGFDWKPPKRKKPLPG